MRTSGLILATCLFLFWPGGQALAGGDDTGDDACGYNHANWDSWKGDLILTRNPSGPIYSVLNTIGEYYTHSIISHGSTKSFAASHSTMHMPGQKSWPDVCDGPCREDELKFGYPGFSHLDPGGLYNYIYGDSVTRSSTITIRAFYNAHGATTSDWLLRSADYRAYLSQKPSFASSVPAIYNTFGTSYENNCPASWETDSWCDLGCQFSDTKCRDAVFLIGSPRGDTGAWDRIPYWMNEYVDLVNTHNGNVWKPAQSTNGAVCSTIVAWSLRKATGLTVSPKTYYNNDSSSRGMLTRAGNALHDAVENECGSFWGWVACGFDSVCDDAGRQIRNCMTGANCNNAGGQMYVGGRWIDGEYDTWDNSTYQYCDSWPWNWCPGNEHCHSNKCRSGFHRDATIRSISPDHLVNSASGSPWASSPAYGVYWSSAGNVYGCWF